MDNQRADGTEKRVLLGATFGADRLRHLGLGRSGSRVSAPVGDL